MLFCVTIVDRRLLRPSNEVTVPIGRIVEDALPRAVVVEEVLAT